MKLEAIESEVKLEIIESEVKLETIEINSISNISHLL